MDEFTDFPKPSRRGAIISTPLYGVCEVRLLLRRYAGLNIENKERSNAARA